MLARDTVVISPSRREICAARRIYEPYTLGRKSEDYGTENAEIQ